MLVDDENRRRVDEDDGMWSEEWMKVVVMDESVEGRKDSRGKGSV